MLFEMIAGGINIKAAKEIPPSYLDDRTIMWSVRLIIYEDKFSYYLIKNEKGTKKKNENCS